MRAVADGPPDPGSRMEAEARALRARIAATDEVLRAIAAQPADPQPIFDLIARRVRDLAGATTASILEYDGTLLHRTADAGYPPDVLAALRAGFPRPPGPDSGPARVVLSGDVVHIADVATDPGVFAPARQLGARSYLGVPLRREGRIVGVLGLGRADGGTFDADTIALAHSFAEQAVIALESARLVAAQREALEQQAVTAEVLGQINRAGFDLPQVLRTLLLGAVRLCGAERAILYRVRDGACHYEAGTNNIPDYERYERENPIRPGRDTVAGRAMLERRTVQIVDALSDPEYGPKEEARRNDVRSMLGVPLLRDGELAGVFALARARVAPFTEREIALMSSFAAQAAVGMRNAELVDALRGRTAELQESLDYQTATSEVLQLISRATFDLQPVLQTLVETMARLCDAELGFIMRRAGDAFVAAASVGYTPEYHALRQAQPLTAGRGTITGRVALERRPVHVTDVAADPEFTLTTAMTVGGQRTALGVPLLRGEDLLGVIILGRRRVLPFTDRQIELVSTFADQAVIAIENTRLITEQREALEQQKAAADILTVISTSMGDVQPVFDRILESCKQLFDGDELQVMLVDGAGLLQSAGYLGMARAAVLSTLPAPAELSPVWPAIRDCRTLHYADVLHAPDTPSVLRSLGRSANFHSVAFAPMVWEGRGIGAIGVARARGPYSARELEVLQGFAAQAVIAIQNTRLITELRESLEQQTATSDVLRLISRTTFDLTLVFRELVETAARLCQADKAAVFMVEKGQFQPDTAVGFPADFGAAVRQIVGSLGGAAGVSAAAQAVRECCPVHYDDVSTIPDYPTAPAMLGGQRTTLAVPLLRDGDAVGVLVLSRSRVEAFTERQIALAGTFADQAVIAIDNTRLLTELRESLEYQGAISGLLRIVSSSLGELEPVFDGILERAHVLCGAEQGSLQLWDGERLAAAATRDLDPEFDAMIRRGYVPAREGSGPGTLQALGMVVHIPDVKAWLESGREDPTLRASVEKGGVRTLLAVPLVKDGRFLGRIVAGRRAVRAFDAKHVALLETFADQAVLAIENARLVEDLRARTAELAARNDAYGEQVVHQSATIDVLKAMSASPADPQPVFGLIAERAMDICGGEAVAVFQFDGTQVHLRHVAARGRMNDPVLLQGIREAYPRPPSQATTSGRVILGRRMVHIRSLQEDPDLIPALRALGIQSQVCLPLMRGEQVVGAINLNSSTPGGLSDRQIELMRTFAEQAVIAIDSAETYRSLQTRTEELARSVSELQALEEVGRAVNASLELDTVLATIIARSVALAQADEGTIYEYDEAAGVFLPKAAEGMTEERIAALRARQVRLGETHLGRAAAEGRVVHVPDVQDDPSLAADAAGILAGIHAVLAVPLLREGKVLGGLVIRRRRSGAFEPGTVTLLQTFAAQCVLAIENARLFEEARHARAAAEAALVDLRRTQDRLVQTEKLASLGQLTAGIAHEIKNPLNFVNNFSDLSAELLEELQEALAPERLVLDATLRAEIEELVATLRGNLGKIAQHGRRADSIVRNMLLHSRGGTGEARASDVNALAAEALNLAYHGARAAQSDFNITLEQDLDPAAGMAELHPQEITRVLLNLIGNGFHAARKHMAAMGPGFAPVLRLATRDLGDAVEIRVRDNGTGIPPEIRERIFQPFFTTKPAGEGTGLGLSLSHDIVVQQHGGRLEVASEPGAFTEFTVTLPRRIRGAR